jgi:hypothetical protein
MNRQRNPVTEDVNIAMIRSSKILGTNCAPCQYNTLKRIGEQYLLYKCAVMEMYIILFCNLPITAFVMPTELISK